jgi:hypothetical protein
MILLEGMLLGILYAIIPGGAILVGLKLAIAPGYSRAAAFTYGVLLIDSMYAFLAVTAATAATDVYVRLSAAHPSLLPGMQIALVAALGGYGVYLLLTRPPSVDGALRGASTGSAESRRVPPHGYLLLGISLKASTIVSPSFLAGFALLTSQAQALGLSGWSLIDRAGFAMGFGIGNFLYLRICMRLASRYTRRLPGTRFLRLQKGLGAAFAALGVLLFLHIIQAWKW